MAKILEILVIAFGGFYVFSAVFLIRTMLSSYPLERALFQMSEVRAPFWLRHQTDYLLSGSWLVGLAGLLAFFRIQGAMGVCIAALLHQAC